MDTYNHFEYGEALANGLAWVDCFLRASSEQDPEDIHEKISRLKGCLLVAVDGKDSGFEYNQSEVLNEQANYCFLLLQQTEAGNPDSVYAAQVKCKRLAREITVRMMADYCVMANGLADLIPDSFELHGIGPMGTSFHGVALSFAVGENWDYQLDPVMWR